MKRWIITIKYSDKELLYSKKAETPMSALNKVLDEDSNRDTISNITDLRVYEVLDD